MVEVQVFGLVADDRKLVNLGMKTRKMVTVDSEEVVEVCLIAMGDLVFQSKSCL